MKIAIPVEAKNPDTSVCISFGRTPYFALYDTETKEFNFIVHTGADMEGGAGIQAAQKIIDKKVSVLITVHCGENAVKVLKAAHVDIYKSKYPSAKENILAYENNNLYILTEIHAGHHGQTR